MPYAQSNRAAITEADAVTDAGFPARLVALVGSRLCHDLVSPLGAVGNGVELLQMAGGPGLADSQEMALIQDALKAARARIDAFRIGFGAAGGGQRVPLAELAGLVAGIEAGGRLRIRLEQVEGDHSRAVVRLVLLGLMCLETGMPWGARVTVRQDGRDWRLRAEAERTRPDPVLWSWLNAPRSTRPDAASRPDATSRPDVASRPDPAPSEVHFPLLGLFAAEAKRRVVWTLAETGGEIAF